MRLWILILSLFLSSTCWAHQPRCELLLRLSTFESASQIADELLGDDEFQSMFLRAPGTVISEKHYLENIALSLSRVFIPWFQRRSSEDFKEMLRAQHRTAVYGATQKFGSGQIYHGEQGISVFLIFPGVLRNDWMGYLFKLKPLDLNYGNLADAGVIALQKPRHIPIEEIPEKAWPVEVPDVTADGRTTAKHIFPSRTVLKHYLRRMARLMDELRDLPPNTSHEVLIRLLASYYYTAIHSHCFFRVNNSIFMSHVNYILSAHGISGISHGFLDKEALTNEEDAFLKIFAKAVTAD